MEGFDIFAEGGDGRPGQIPEIMAMLQHQIEEHDLSWEDGIGILLDLVRPGNSERSHDVKPMFVGAMYALGFGEVAKSFGSLYLNEMPWGIGFAVGVEPEFEYAALSAPAQRAVIQSLAAVLESGGLSAAVTDDNKILLKRGDDDDDEGEIMSIDHLVGQFRTEMESELPKILGDDKPDDPWRRWLP